MSDPADNEARALCQAASLGDVEQIKSLLESGANIELTDENGYTALHCAAEQGHAAVARELCQWAFNHGMNRFDVTGVHNNFGEDDAMKLAVKGGFLDVVDVLLEYGYSDPHFLNFQDSSGLASLHYAVLRGHKHIVLRLLESGAPINHYSADTRRTPLHFAITHSNEKYVYYGQLETDIHYGKYYCDTEMLDLLLGVEGVDVDARDCTDNTALHMAARLQSPYAVAQLLKKGVEDVNAESGTSDALTPLDTAVLFQREDVVRTILQAESVNVNLHDPTICSHNSTLWIAYHSADDLKHGELMSVDFQADSMKGARIALMLVDAGADVGREEECVQEFVHRCLEVRERELKERRLAFLMGRHDRLGSKNAELQAMTDDLMQMILEMITNGATEHR